MNEGDIIESYGSKKKGDYTFHEGECFLKTKSDRFKKHWGVIMGNEIYCYRYQNDPVHRVMHCLVGTFIKEMTEEKSPESRQSFYPVKIVLPPNKSRVLYFSSE